MIFILRKHLYAANFIFFIVIYIMQKLAKMFCIIENCGTDNHSKGEESDAAGYSMKAESNDMHKAAGHFGFGGDYFKIVVQKNQRQPSAAQAF